MKRFRNVSDSPQTSRSVLARCADKREHFGKVTGLRHCATSTPGHPEQKPYPSAVSKKQLLSPGVKGLWKQPVAYLEARRTSDVPLGSSLLQKTFLYRS